jgi:beta-phosphoglucomutase
MYNIEIKGLIFDLDGVIADTANLHYKAWCKIGEQWGFNLSLAQNEELKGVSRKDSILKIANWAGKSFTNEELDAFAFEKNKNYLSYCQTLGTKDILPGVYDFINASMNKGLKLAVGSASKNAKIILQKLGILDLFSIIVDGNMVQNSKPDPEVFIKGAEILELEPKSCVVFEDSQAGIQAAISAGMFSVGVGQEDLESCNYRIKNFEGLSSDQLINQLSNRCNK